jgi:hypothetical protein
VSIALVVLAFGCLIAAAYLWQRNKKTGVDGLGTSGTRIAIIALMLAGVLSALASQLPVFSS